MGELEAPRRLPTAGKGKFVVWGVCLMQRFHTFVKVLQCPAEYDKDTYCLYIGTGTFNLLQSRESNGTRDLSVNGLCSRQLVRYVFTKNMNLFEKQQQLQQKTWTHVFIAPPMALIDRPLFLGDEWAWRDKISEVFQY